MKLALIPPISMLEDVSQMECHLMLPHLVENSQTKYADFFSCMSTMGRYIILDNGAAEGIDLPDSYLISVARSYDVDEVAVPDILGDSDLTIARAFHFFSEQERAIASIGMPSFGIVAQGESEKEAMQTVRAIMHSRWSADIDVVYLPRLLLQRARDKDIRIKLATRIHDEFGGVLQIHLFGASNVWPGEVRVAADVPYIRSMDTSMPYVYSYHRAALDLDRNTIRVPEPRRPDGYFHLPSVKFPDVNRYVDKFVSWAGGGDGTQASVGKV